MKFMLEFNPHELKAAINSGALLALAESIEKTETEAANLATIINTKPEREPGTSCPAPVETPMQQPAQPAAFAPPAVPVQTAFVPPVQTPTTPPVAPPAAPAAVPTAAQTYTLDQLAVAGTQLMDAGRTNELRQLLATFGVPALTALKPDQYGAFATQLRAMGAKI